MVNELKTTKKCGVLLPVFSLPGNGQVGGFSEQAKRFIDFLGAAGQDCWQVLPLTIADEYGSPYSSKSGFAIDPDYIDLAFLAGLGLLKRDELDFDGFFRGVERKNPRHAELIGRAFSEFTEYRESKFGELNAEFEAFKEQESYWLSSYSLFVAIEEREGKKWSEWKDEYKNRDKAALKKFSADNKERIEYHSFLQFLCDKSWRELKAFASSRGIEIIGDLPIYLSYDSADVWSEREVFALDEEGRPVLVGGCPPDEFNEKGQLWGNPVYDWDRLKDEGYDFWLRRLKRAERLYDIVRLDHFRGFESFFAVSADAPDARTGQWLKAGGSELFAVAGKKFPNLQIIAEDLGFITKEVRALVEETGFPNMKVLQFAFDGNKDNEHLPSNYTGNCAAYTGTHDNDTCRGWYSSLSFGEKLKVAAKTGKGLFRSINDAMIATLLKANAKYVIIPLADYMGLGRGGRINTPGTVGNHNWSFRLNDFPDIKLAYKMKKNKEKYVGSTK